jgi:3-methyladenine DNA glycosylase AlkD
MEILKEERINVVMIKLLVINYFMTFIENLETDLINNRAPEKVVAWESYMKNNFQFLGVVTEKRRLILKKHLDDNKQEIKTNFRTIAWKLFNKKEREFHYCGQEIIIKEIKKKYVKEDIYLIEKFITTNSWWDSVDFLAKYLLGNYLLQFPEEKYKVIERFSNSDNLWLNRSAIIFQLSYKQNTDFDLLKSECEKHKDSNAFFIQKAIGWALRDYSKYNPNGVREYVNATHLKPLSQKEALRKIK